MAKTIIKEAGIVILLLIAVVLLLSIIFYEFIPNNKTVPIKIQAYEIPGDIKEELQYSITDEQNIVRTFYIDSSDLDLYESTKDYNKGKANPFADYTVNNTTTTNSTNTVAGNTTGNSVSSANNTVGTNTNSSTNSGTNRAEENEVYINTPGKNY